MALRLKLTTPFAFTYRAVLVDRIDSIDVNTREVHASVTLIPADGSRKRSVNTVFNLTQNQLDSLLNNCLNRIANKVERIDGLDVNLAGTIEDVPEGSPVT